LLLEHFEKLQPFCPVCNTGEPAPLRIASRQTEAGGHLIHGVLHCSRPDCMHEFPVIDGVPVVLAGARDYVRENLLAMVMRADLSSDIESLLGDCAGASSVFEATRQQQSAYGYGHYGYAKDAGCNKASVYTILEVCLELAGGITGPVLEIGCGAGGVAQRLAATVQQPVVAMDLNFSLLQIATSAARNNRVTFPRRRIGLVYDRMEIELPPQQRNASFWLGDAVAAPWAEGMFQTIVALNVLDSTPSPLQLLQSAGRLLAPGGKLLLSCPFDWSPRATPVDQWLGGHSQRGPHGGDSAAILHETLGNWQAQQPADALQIIAARDDVPWRMYVHERSHVEYRTHCLALRRPGG